MRRVFDGGDGCDRGGMFCRSMERGEWARRLLKEDGEEVVEVGGEDDEVDCDAISARFCGAVSDRESGSDAIALAIMSARSLVDLCIGQ
jgi:hypothetical protein